MTWKAGLLRLWIVVSLLWVLTIGLLASDLIGEALYRAGPYQYVMQIRPDLTGQTWNRPFYELAYAPGQGKYPETFASVENENRQGFEDRASSGKMTVIEFPNGSSLYLSSDMTEPDKTWLSKLFWEQRWGRYADKMRAPASIMVLPPIAVLLLGLAAAWIARGFAPTKPTGPTSR